MHHLIRDVVLRLRDEIYGHAKTLLLDLREALYARDFDRAQRLTNELLAEMYD